MGLNILVLLVALLHIYFCALEMIFWTKPLGLKVFRNSLEKAQNSKVLAANQGLYNLFLAAGLIWSTLHPDLEFGLQLKTFFLACVMFAGLYGAYTVSKKIFYIQALPAILGLALILFLYAS